MQRFIISHFPDHSLIRPMTREALAQLEARRHDNPKVSRWVGKAAVGSYLEVDFTQEVDRLTGAP